MHVLITGGGGFIGGHVIEMLCSQNHQVTIVDNLDPYYDIQQKVDHLQQVSKKGSTFEFIKGDLLEEDFCKSVFSDSKFDAVIHLAAIPGVTYSIVDPHKYIDMDIKATVNVLKYSGEANVKHVLFASSSSVYGNQGAGPLAEIAANGNVVSPYAAAKYGAESFCHAYQSLYGFQLTILRFFTVYGPWGRPDMAIPKFIRKLIRNETIEVFGEGLARDFTYIEDIANGIRLALNHSRGIEIYNLGNGKPVSMERLLDHLKVRFPKMKQMRKPMRKGDVTITWSDITKAQQELGYKPMVSIEEGLDRTISWAKQYFEF
ncbi:NAD-dependent epimerase/dehydratase family protein [Bacillus sp. Marseille-P3661]|uniref:NAD-dependent epimerase/dehydratase family protein n=1 Tax=Bacillus sp. Marseille-P3661 TaxID=1936234 RepID=UPI000C83BB59|nr:NAD-dependent epimerase/dehydratase family protein [Bacillus sp. Marseille-P3661]